MEWLFSLIADWIVVAVVLVVIDRLDIGLRVGGFGNALVAAVVLSVLNVLLGGALRLIALPLQILCLGLLTWLLAWLINAVVLYVASKVTPGFHISNYRTALVAALIISVLGWVVGTVSQSLFG